MSLFYERIYGKLLEVPRGKITTYKDLAHALKSKAYRTVGTAMRKNPYAPKIPCHRVIRSNGRIGPYSAKGGMGTKIKLLEREGIKISNGKIIDFKNFLYKY